MKNSGLQENDFEARGYFGARPRLRAGLPLLRIRMGWRALGKPLNGPGPARSAYALSAFPTVYWFCIAVLYAAQGA
jgi:hypothetical protein